MSSASRRAGQVTWRYVLAKLSEARHEMMAQATPAVGLLERASQFVQTFQHVYARPSTSVMLLAGTAMCPTLNAHALKDRNAVDKLVVRLIPRPGPDTVAIGDLVSFSNPKKETGEQNLMVRRVAAMQGDVLEVEDSDDDEAEFVLPSGHCWVLADNEDLPSLEVVDSRTFGPLPYDNIRGRVIYQASSMANHGMVQNNPIHMGEDAAVIEAEVDVQQLLEGMQKEEQ